MKGVLAGAVRVIDRFFGVERIGTKAPHFQHKQSCVQISKNPIPEFESLALLEELYRLIEANWERSQPHYGKPPSQKNWRMTRHPQFAQHNTSPEVTLERRIIQATDETWINQVPPSSGLTGPRKDNRHIDLVHNLGHGNWEFIELKVNSDTPLFAALEIVQYGLLFLFCRHHQEALGFDASKALLQAAHVHLKVLAPSRYYTCNNAPELYQLQWLEESLNEGLRRFVDERTQSSLQMDFQFEAFPSDFIWPPANGAADHEAIRVALRDRRPVYACQHILK